MGNHSVSGIRRAALSFVVALGLVWSGAAVQAADPFAVLLAQHDAKIALSEAMEAEGKRQASERMNELRQWVGWWESVQALAQEKQIDLQKNIEQRSANAGLLTGMLGGLTSNPKQERYIPNYGWSTLETAAALQTSLALEAKQLRDAIAEGKENWYIVAIGWITGGAIQTRIDALEDEIALIEKGVASGEYTFHSAFGWQTIIQHRRMAQEQRAELARVKDQIAKGEYALEIPGIGRITRNQLDARINDVEAAINQLKKSGAAGELTIFRPAIDWVTRNQLQQRADATETSYQTAKALVSDGLFTVHIAGAGGDFWTRDALEEKIAAFDKAITDISAAISTGDYSAQVMGDFYSLKALTAIIQEREKRLADPALNQVQRNQITEQIDAAHKAIKEWRDLSAFDLTIKALDKTKYLAWVGWIMKLAKPDFDHRTLVREEQNYHMGSFDGELALKLKPLEAQRDGFYTARTWFSSN
ncbi:MAG: hypothetical protein WCC57_00215 [Paracoccaceae bacterium]